MSPKLTWDRLKAKANAINLPTRFFILTTLVLVFGMTMLGIRIVTQTTNDILKAQTMTGRTFINLYLAPHVQSISPIDGISQAVKRDIDQLMKDSPLDGRVLSVKIWTVHGKMVYNSLNDLDAEKLTADVIKRIWNGEVIVEYNQVPDNHAAIEKETNLPLFEVYAPIYRTGTNQVIAIGEYYENVSWLINPLREERIYTWMYTAAITAAMLAMMSILIRKAHLTITSQSIELKKKISTANELAAENNALRLQADKARLGANEANEQLLARIGADLHDGPIQIISLLILKLSAMVPDAAKEMKPGGGIETPSHSILEFTQEALNELRTISAGLSLPEIENLSLQEAIELAIFRHEDLTGTKVGRDFGALPNVASLAFKTCVYRVIQESLTNSHKHTQGATRTVSVFETGGLLKVSIADNGPGLPESGDHSGKRPTMGLSGIRNRVDVFKGSFNVESKKGKGTTIIVELPLLPTGTAKPKSGTHRHAA